MTNFEWFKSDDEKLKRALTCHWGVNKITGKVGDCGLVTCCNCSFYDAKKPCSVSREVWPNKEHEPLYKNGDIVISKNGKIYLVFKEIEGKCIVVSDNVDAFERDIGIYISKDEIERKIGNIYKDTASDLAYEIVGNYIMIMKEV